MEHRSYFCCFMFVSLYEPIITNCEIPNLFILKKRIELNCINKSQNK